MKKIQIIFLALVILFLTACSWFVDLSQTEDSESLEYGTVCGILEDSEEIKNIRSAFPEMPSPVVYTIIAHRTDIEAEDINGIIDTVTSSYIIKLTEGTWTINLKGYNCATLADISTSNLVFYGSKENVVISEENPYYANLNITVYIRMEEELKGTVQLPIYAYSNIITSANAKWLDSTGVQKTQTLTFTLDAATKLYKSVFTMTDDTDGVSAITAGSYAVSFEFYRTISGVSTLAYYCQDTVNVYSNMVTNSWIDSSNDSEYLSIIGTKKQLYLSEDHLKKFLSNSFFVKNDGDDSHIGNYYQPFKTIQHAVDVIKEINDGGSQYCVYLLSDLEDSAVSASYTAANNYSYVNITTSGTASEYLKLLIGSFGTTQYTVNLNRSATKTGGFIYCNGGNTSTVYQTVTLRNLKITGGYSTQANYAAGVTVTTSKVNLVSCSITDNTGSGIVTYTTSTAAYTVVSTSGDTVISNNTIGIYLAGGTCNIAGNAQILQNTTGVHLKYANTSYAASFTVDGNITVKENSEGIYIQRGTLTFNNSATIKDNTSYGIYHESGYFYIKGKVIITGNGTLAQPKNYRFTKASTAYTRISVNGSLDGSSIGVYLEDNMSVSSSEVTVTLAASYYSYNAALPCYSVFTSDQNYTLGKGLAVDLVISYQKGSITTKSFDNFKLIPSTSSINKAISGEGSFRVFSIEDNAAVELKSLKLETFRNGKSVAMEQQVTNASSAALDFTNKALGKYVIVATAVKEITNSDGSITTKTYTADFPLTVTDVVPVKGSVITPALLGNNDTLEKTSMICVVAPNTQADITGSDESWNTYYSGTSNVYKGAFINGRNVQLDPYAIGAYEVTVELYRDVMASEENCYKGNFTITSVAGEKSVLQPVRTITWYDALYFCNALTKRTMGEENCVYTFTGTPTRNTSGNITSVTVTADMSKTGYRLPTEAEWEYAARGGDTTATEWKYGFPGINPASKISTSGTNTTTLNNYGWYTSNSRSNATYTPHQVGLKTANYLGIYDMAGNIMEMCFDNCEYPYNGSYIISAVDAYDSLFLTGAGKINNPKGKDTGTYYVARGGYYSSSASECLVSYRTNVSKSSTNNVCYGIRLCRTLK